ncbi:uncharacterized protein BO96DRAFT_461232 [Aspergillus niger CBS 101883]|uniref:uncharacterized protein n=1 Tax=Aspergillus lacticoffeatus (strain CBS 101883) TaxID=1450533 RepID=UPI000D7F1064|nr:uncharacterized protein BO96DRAFT_461232 [Aspergillus niger CBS 101883]PYH61727.1 hypothetical protein BO96DRAFT_461232 [Aspergillus niger CBS 101883]
MGDASAQIRKVNYAWWQKDGSSQVVAPDLITAVDHQPAVGCSLQQTGRKYNGSNPRPEFCQLWAVGMSIYRLDLGLVSVAYRPSPIGGSINGTNEQPTEMTTGMPGSEESARCAWGRSATHPPTPLSSRSHPVALLTDYSVWSLWDPIMNGIIRVELAGSDGHR